MLQVIRNAWMDTQLRKKILYTLFIIVLFRLGSAIYVPYLNNEAIGSMFGDGSLFTYLNTMTGGAMAKGTLLAMSISPYINASIIIQLLTYAIPPLEKLSKEGEEGRKKINYITKFAALGIALVQAFGFYLTLKAGTTVNDQHVALLKYGDVYDYTSDTFSVVLSAITIIACLVAGASLIIWLGDRINEKGIGNGISMILFAGIIADVPNTINYFIEMCKSDMKNLIFIIIYCIVMIAMVWFVIFITNSERRIPIQYAKRVVGRKMYGGQSTHIPIKVAMTGVMPIIFASTITMLPQTICGWFGITGQGDSFWDGFIRVFNYSTPLYAIIYFLLIIAFTYFYVSMTYNPVEIANNLKQNNGAIPGYRPGKPTADFIYNSLNKITLIGAIFLGIIAIFPIIFSMVTGMTGVQLGGTTILIVVSVALETVRTLESQIMVRHHGGFLD